MDVQFSDDSSRIDRTTVHRWLSDQAYWAMGRSREVQDAAIDGSWNFGAYDTATGRQLAYARVVTDRATFAWIADVFVDPGERGRGLGTALMGHVMSELVPLHLKRILLATADAHALYEKFGFAPPSQPDRLLEHR